MEQKPAGFQKIFSERTQRLIDMSKNQFVRRSSDASISGKNGSGNEFNNFASTSASTVSRKDNRRRLQFRKRRLDCRRSVEVKDLAADNETELKSAVGVLYNDLISSKPPIDAFQSFLASLRQYFTRQTWSDCVETLLKSFLTQNILLEASKLAEKYIKVAPDTPLSSKLDEYKFQVLLHLFTMPCDDHDPSSTLDALDTVVNLLRMIDFMSDHKILLDFLEEDIFEIFVDVLPRQLAHLYEELGQPIPPELSSYASVDNFLEESFFEPIVIPSPMKIIAASSEFGECSKLQFNNEDSNHSCASQSAKSLKRSQSWFDNKHHTMITIPSSGAKKLKLGKKVKREIDIDDDVEKETKELFKEKDKKVKNPRRSLMFSPLASSSTRILSAKRDNRKIARTPSGKHKSNCVPETPTFHQIPASEKRRRKMKKAILDRGSRLIVNETPPRLWAKIPVLVRQSPRQHASTRSLYSSVPSLLSQLQKNVGGDHLPPDLTVDVDNDDDDDESFASPSSPKFVLIKAKKGYTVKASTTAETASSTKKQQNNFLSELPTLVKEKTPTKTPTLRKHKSIVYDMDFDEDEDDYEMKSPELFPEEKIEYATTSASSPVKRTKKNLAKTFFSPTPKQSVAVEKCRKSVSTVVETKQCGKETKTAKNKQNAAENSLSPVNKNNCRKNVDDSADAVPPLKLKLKRTESIESSTSSGGRHTNTMTTRESRSNAVKRQNSLTTSDYTLPSFAADNYIRYMTNIKKERNKPPKPGDDPFYGRGTRRNSVFYENSTVSKCYPDELKAPKNRSGRKMKSSVEFFHLANYLLNVSNKNPSSPVILKNLQRTVKTPIKLNKKLRLASKGGRKRAKLQCKEALSNSTSGENSIDDVNGMRKFPTFNEKIESQQKLKCARLCSTDTDCSEEFGPVIDAATTKLNSMNIKTECLDDSYGAATKGSGEISSPSAYNLRTRKGTFSECDMPSSLSSTTIVVTGSKTASPPSDANQSGVASTAFHRRNIFEWAEHSTANLIEEDVFSSSASSTTSASNANYGRWLLNVNV